MIKIFTTPNCLGCKLTKEFFDKKNIPYTIQVLSEQPFSDKDIKDILSISEGGFDDIISINAPSFKKLNVNFDDLSFQDGIELIKSNSNIIHRPIVIQYLNDHPVRLLIGYNSNDINVFTRNDFEKFYKFVPCEFAGTCRNDH
jgi:Spx/MgsR family transcriptional regulator